LEVRSYQCCEGIAHLTETELQVAAQLFAGASYKEAAKALGLCPSTVNMMWSTADGHPS
jgi:DNA-binding NarL/FixJ family response regulator